MLIVALLCSLFSCLSHLYHTAHTKKQLDDYFESNQKVKIIRATKREGLIRARLLGAKYATAPVLTYLDSHCECTVGKYRPFLAIHHTPHIFECGIRHFQFFFFHSNLNHRFFVWFGMFMRNTVCQNKDLSMKTITTTKTATQQQRSTKYV